MKRVTFCLACFLSVSLTVSAQTKVKPKDLALKYQEWLKLTTYIIKDKEKDAFLSLFNDRDRDLFMEAFWKIRDPTPGTPQNEFKDELIKRFNDANKKYGRRSSRPGWMTDQGRYHIILGPPSSVEDIAGSTEIYSCEIWSYYGDPAKGMPTHFSLVFFQKGGAGEFKLYDPFVDGPAALLVSGRNMDPSDYSTMYWKIFDLQPDLAHVCLSIIPGEIPYGFQPAADTAIWMASITESPKKLVNESYATHFLNYRGVVSTEYMTNFIDSETSVAVAPDPVTGITFCDFAITPKRLSLDYYTPKDEYSCGFQIDVSLRDGKKIIFQYSKDYPLTIPAAQLEEVQGMGVCIADSFPLIEGKYQLTVLLRNTTGKEFCILESNLDVPAESANPRIVGPVLGYKLADAVAGSRLPFQAVDKKMNVDPKNTYIASDQIAFFFNIIGLTQDLWKEGNVGVLLKGSKAGNPYQKSWTVPLNRQVFHHAIAVTQSMAAADLPPDYYDMTLSLKDGNGRVLDERKTTFAVSPEKSISHPLVASKAFSLSNSFVYFYMLAHQYDQMNQNEKAEEMFKKARALNPAYLQKLPEYAGFLLKIKKFGEALDLVESLKDDEKLRFQYYSFKGQAQMGLEKYNEAIENLIQGNKIFNSDSVLLNALGQCFFKTGQKQNALNALNASLKLNPDQPDVKNLIQTIEGKK